ncbi:hypothetical protein PV377_03125 [Streptomyces ipomoeae]|uniref:hypothetical protein n=1 Tax=Streptomyces ipomoeae TaxID=103232 RepID=UPI0029AE0261|nr:hypothetical protein [Streptomyces ipomoeae]MDX2838005.1 hypothetical protein [Streptomyces ipomoeae]
MKGAGIEIIDRHRGDIGFLAPSAVRINGVEVLLPADSKIRIGDISEDEAVTVTITMFARRIVIAPEADLNPTEATP